MAANNKYEAMSAFDALKYVKNRNMLLPDIQREYVWDFREIENLFESIVAEYPIGTCIFWKTTRTNLNEQQPNLYYFHREFIKGKSKNEKAPEYFHDEDVYYIVLDGQQRITSLNIALNGTYTSYKGGRGHPYNNPNSWVTRELYYDLEYYNPEFNHDGNRNKRFVFMNSKDAKPDRWYKVKQLLAFDSLDNYLKSLLTKGYSKSASHDLAILFQRLQDSSGNGLIHYFAVIESDYDKALDIFVRVNSTGRKLSKSDLLFSTLIDGWREGKENIDNLLASMNCKGDGFRFDRDYLMRLGLLLVDANTSLKIQSLSTNTVSKIRMNWDKIKYTAESLSDLLMALGLSHQTLTSYNSAMPIAYYLYRGGKIQSAQSKQEVKKYLSIAMAKRLFSSSGNNAMNATRSVLSSIDCSNTPFTMSLFSQIKLPGGQTFLVTQDDIDYWLEHYEKGANTYTLLSLLYPNLKLSQFTFHQDHCHPYSGFGTNKLKKIGLTLADIQEWQRKRNLLPNLQFLEGKENEIKNAMPLKEWIAKGNTIQYYPDAISPELKDFDIFFAARKQLMKRELLRLFGLDAK